MPGAWKTVRVFISSTFRDMHAERDHLVKVTFPALREKLLPFRVELYDIDLRWGVTKEQAENDQVLDLCLQQIDECRPFFVGILGDRYGWVPEKFPVEALKKYGWIAHHTGRSVTELEIIHGVLANPAMRGHAFFYFRDPRSLADMPEAVRHSVFAETDPAMIAKLAELKHRIRESGFPVSENYPAHWDGSAFDRPTKATGRLTGLEEFGKGVHDQLWEAIRAELKLDDASVVLGPLAEETDFHERFMESRLRVYVGRQTIQDELLLYSDGADEKPCLVTGPSGSGKSAVLARFVTTWRQQHSQAFVLPHFVGASPRSTGLRDLLYRLCMSLKTQFTLADEVPEETARLMVTFRDMLGKIPADDRVLIVLDALNQLDESDRAQHLEWLPAKLPAQVKVVVSCIADSGKTEPVLKAFKHRPHVAINVKPLDDTERRAIIREVPSLSAKTLDEKQIDALLANPATANPLFLLVSLEELRGFGSYEQLNQRISTLPRDSDTVTAIFTQVIERLEEEFDRDTAQSILTLLASARRGLSERELQELMSSVKGKDDFFPILRQLRPYLLSRGGLQDFYHRNLFKAVRERYLKEPEQQSAGHARLVAYFQAQDYFLESLEEQRARAKRLPPTPRPANIRKVDELPWQLLNVAKLSGKDDPKSPHWDAVADLFTDLHFLEAKVEAAG
jgi:telomerase protein component 1